MSDENIDNITADLGIVIQDLSRIIRRLDDGGLFSTSDYLRLASQRVVAVHTVLTDTQDTDND